MSVRDELREVLSLLEAEGVVVGIAAGRLVVEGQHDGLSDRARCAVATLEGRTAGVRRVLAEPALSLEEKARLDETVRTIAATRAEDALDAEKAKKPTRAKAKPGRCPNGHARTDASTFYRPGRGRECCQCRRDRVREAKLKRRTAAAKAKAAASPKRHGPPPRSHCLHGGHELTPSNVYTSKVTGRRRCRECVRRRDRERRKRSRLNYSSAPKPISLEATE